jgi:hypothetical protein
MRSFIEDAVHGIATDMQFQKKKLFTMVQVKQEQFSAGYINWCSVEKFKNK